MSKKHFIALAELFRKPGHIEAAIQRGLRPFATAPWPEDEAKIQRIKAELAEELADFLKSQNGAFDRERWLGYVRGENGPSGGKVGK